MELLINDSDIESIALKLKDIYTQYLFEMDIENPSILLEAVVKSVENNNKYTKEFVDSNPAISYSINFSKDLVERFINELGSLLKDAYNTIIAANDIVQNTSDLMAIVVPYILVKMNINNAEIGLVFDLCLLLAKIFIDTQAKKQEKLRNDIVRRETTNMFKANLEYLRKISDEDSNTTLNEYKIELEHIIDVLDDN